MRRRCWTTGRPFGAGCNTRSQLTYMLFTSISASIPCSSGLHRFDSLGHHAPDRQLLVIIADDVCDPRVRGLKAKLLALLEEATASQAVVDDSNDDMPMGGCDGSVDEHQIAVVDARLAPA